MLIVALGNGINGVLRNENVYYFIFYSFIFIAISISIQFFKLKKSEMRVSILLLIISIVALWFDDIRSLFGLMLLTYSIIISDNNKKHYIVYFALAIITVILRFALYSHSSTGFIIYLAGSAFILIIYQHYIHPKVNNKNNKEIILKDYDSQKVKNVVVDIIQLRVQGFDWWEINDKLELNINDSELPRKVREERKRLKFKTQDEFNFWLFKNGIIKPISSESNIQA